MACNSRQNIQGSTRTSACKRCARRSSGFLCVPSEDCGWRETAAPAQDPGGTAGADGTGRAGDGRTRACLLPDASTRPAKHNEASAAASTRSVAAPGVPRSCFPDQHLQKGPRVSVSFPRHRHEARSMRAMPARPAEQEPSASRPDPSTATRRSAPSLPTSTVGGVRSTSSS